MPILALAVACTAAPEPPPPNEGSPLLYVWAGDADEADPDFLAVVHARSGSPDYGRVVTTVPVEGRGNVPHHTEYALTPGRSLFANGWGTTSTAS